MHVVYFLGRHPSLGVAALLLSVGLLGLWERGRLSPRVGDPVGPLLPLLASLSVLATLILFGARFVTVLTGNR